MAGLRTSREVQEQVNNLRRQGLGPRAIARSLGISRNTVRAILRRDPDWKDARQAPPWAAAIAWDLVAQDYGKGVTLKSLHATHAPDVTYMSFWHEFRARVPAQVEPTMRLVHKPGDKTFFDFCDGIPIVNRATGQKIKTQLLVAVLPFSSLTVGEFTADQKQPTFVRAMENAFRRLGGVSPYVVVDNLKPAVARAHIYDPDVNRAFVEFANHMGSEDGDALALHARLKASERASTQEAHYPEQKLAAARFEVRYAVKEAERIGPKTFILIQSLLEGSHPLKHLRRAQGILRLKTSGQVSSQALEHAAERAMLFNKKQFAYVKAAALFFEARGTSSERSVMAAPVRSLNEVYLHHQPTNPLKED